MNLYIVRHGESVSNSGEAPADAPDPELSHKGRLQADCLGESLKSVRFDRIWSSPLSRAAGTAAAVAKRQGSGAVVNIIPELCECGTPPDFEQDPAVTEKYCPGAVFSSLRAGVFSSDRERAEYCIDTLVKREAYESGFTDFDGATKSRDFNVLITAHGEINGLLIASLMNIPSDDNIKIAQGNTCVNLFALYVVDGQRRVKMKKINDTSHLPEWMRT